MIKIIWLFKGLGKLGQTQKKIANDINLKIDLINNTLTRIDEQIPENFGEAFVSLYGITQESKETRETYSRNNESVC